MKSDFMKGYNAKATTMISVHVADMEEIRIEIDKLENETFILRIEDATLYMTERQAEQLFEVLERELYEETFSQIEDKYRTEKVRRERLEEEVEELRQQLSEVRRYA